MITEINISGFKVIENCQLNLTPLTILTGANSSGKSSVIQAIILLIKNSKTENEYSMEGITKYLDDFLVIKNKNINAKEIFITVKDDENKEHILNITPDDILFKGDLDYLYESKNNEKEILYLSANRLGAQEIVTASDRKIGNMGEFIFSTFEKMKLHTIDDALIISEESKTLGFQLAYWISTITDEQAELVTSRSGEQILVSYKLNHIEGTISPFNIGAGISYLAKVIITCLIAKKGDLVLLENPEVQLHPKSQSKLGAFLSFVASKGIQLIVETHCEHLINRVRLEVSEENIKSTDVSIHYKSSALKSFQSIYINDDGNYIDIEDNRICFPKGFFDTSVDLLLSLR